MINRRDFMRNTALGLAAFAVSREPDLTFANPYDLPIGLQLYSVRRQMAKDPEGTLKRVAAIGYKEVEVDGKTYGGAANLGYNPTFGDTDLSLEAHLFDFDRDIYGKPITVRFIDRLRDEVRFSGPDQLVAQIKKDVDTAKKILSAVERKS